MSPSSLAGKELPGSYTLSDVFEFRNLQQRWNSVENGGKTSSFVGSFRYFSS